jgi:peptidoglycan hydrolase-like protein with peptidoglycan-binding domain
MGLLDFLKRDKDTKDTKDTKAGSQEGTAQPAGTAQPTVPAQPSAPAPQQAATPPTPQSTTPKPAPPVPPYPGQLLREGSAGPAVRTWQAKMAQRGWMITPDGIYGPRSAQVCRSFQSEKGLSVDGVVGPTTWRMTWEAPITPPSGS